MAQLLVLSDSHVRSYEELASVLKEAVVEADWVIHCGDYTEWEVVVGLRQKAENFSGVCGNADSLLIRQELPHQVVLEVEGKKVAVAHPLWGGPPFPPERMFKLFPPVDVILYGHTHEAVNTWLGQTLMLNPGQGYRSYRVPASYGLITIRDGEVSAEIRFF